MAQLQALLFDLDGTLADTEEDGHRPAFNAAFQAAGLDWHWDQDLYRDLLQVTGGRERIHHYIRHYQPRLPAGIGLDDWVAELHQHKTRWYQNWLDTGAIPLRPGVARLLREASAAGLALGIATTTSLANVAPLLGRTLGTDPGRLFQTIAAGDLVQRKKPAPDLYLLALNDLGLTADQVWVVEDSSVGVGAAWDAGIRSILVTPSPYTQGQDFSLARLVVDSLGEPGHPSRSLAGPPLEQDWVDLALLRRLHEERGP